MSYADGLLSTGERITYRAKQHPFIWLWGSRFTILAIAGAVVLFWLGGNLDPTGTPGTIRTILGWVTAVLFFGALGVFSWNLLRYVNQEYVLTNRRVIQVSGVLNRVASDSSLEKINDAALAQSVFGRMFDFGDLTILTAADTGVEQFRMIKGPITFKKAMLDAKHEFEVDMERSGWSPGPPIRQPANAPSSTEARADPSPAPAVPAPAAMAPDAPRPDPDEVMRTLGNLADLRDRGAIDEEEYQSKKAELLARL